MDIAAYLKRINYSGSLAPTADVLRQLHVGHLLSVPFENLSIHSGEPIVLDDGDLFEKIVTRRRGGFCYELNGLFAALLRASGFNVTMLSAEVANAAGGFGPPFDHMALLVTLAEPWLVDVGFGDSFREPILLEERTEQVQHGDAYRVDVAGDRLVLMRRSESGEWKAQYRFSLQPHVYADYAAMCRYHQTSPESHFTQRRICSRATADGRMTLSEMRLIATRGGERQERELADDTEYADALRDHFGIVMGSCPPQAPIHASLTRLLLGVLALIAALQLGACAPRESPPVNAAVPAVALDPATPPETLLADLEKRLLDAPSLHLHFAITAEGAVNAAIEGKLDLTEGPSVEIEAAGVFDDAPVKLHLHSDGQAIEGGAEGHAFRQATPPALREALILGLTRMGALHNLARLTDGAPPDHAAGGVREWLEAREVQRAPEAAGADPVRVALTFLIYVSGQQTAEATLWLDRRTGLPIQREVVVTFPTGKMRVVEKYTFLP